MIPRPPCSAKAGCSLAVASLDGARLKSSCANRPRYHGPVLVADWILRHRRRFGCFGYRHPPQSCGLGVASEERLLVAYTMPRRLFTLLRVFLFGPADRGREVWARLFEFRPPPPNGTCAYCRKHRALCEVRGPLGTGGVFVCSPCAKACISLMT